MRKVPGDKFNLDPLQDSRAVTARLAPLAAWVMWLVSTSVLDRVTTLIAEPNGRYEGQLNAVSSNREG